MAQRETITIDPLPTSELSAPVFSLPPELLLSIFDFLAAVSPVQVPGGQLGWVAQTTHVCRAWRALALSHTTMWTRIKLSDFEYDSHLGVWEAMFERSGDAPLCVLWTILDEPGWDPLCEQLVLTHIARVAQLHFVSENILPKTTLAPILRRIQCAPILTDLVVSTKFIDDVDFVGCAQARAFLERHAQGLERLKWSGVDFAWSATYANLVVLELDIYRFPPGLTIRDAACRITEMKNLRRLEMRFSDEFSFVPAEIESSRDNSTPLMSSLRNITLIGHADWCYAMWTLLVPKYDSHISAVSFFCQSLTLEKYIRFLSYLRTRIQAAIHIGAKFRSVSVKRAARGRKLHFALLLGETKDIHIDVDTLPPPRKGDGPGTGSVVYTVALTTTFHLRPAVKRTDWLAHTEFLAEHIPLETVEAIRLSSPSDDDSQPPRKISPTRAHALFAKMRGVEQLSLRVPRPFIHALLQAMEPPQPPPQDPSSEPRSQDLLLPALVELELKKVDLRSGHKQVTNGDVVPNLGSALVRVLEARKKHSSTTGSEHAKWPKYGCNVRLHSCEVDDDVCKALKDLGLVVDVSQAESRDS